MGYGFKPRTFWLEVKTSITVWEALIAALEELHFIFLNHQHLAPASGGLRPQVESGLHLL